MTDDKLKDIAATMENYQGMNNNLLNKAYNVLENSLSDPDQAVDSAKFIMKNLGHNTGFHEKQITENKNYNLTATVISNVSAEQASNIAKAFLYESEVRDEYIQQGLGQSQTNGLPDGGDSADQELPSSGGHQEVQQEDGTQGQASGSESSDFDEDATLDNVLTYPKRQDKA